MNLKSLCNDELILKTQNVIRTERNTTADVIRHFQEISDRKLYLERGYANFYEMVTKYFGYCPGSAMRRINSMRLIQEIPSVEEKIESGKLTLSVASEGQSFFYQEAKAERAYSKAAKLELIESCVGKSKREVERKLCRISPEREKREMTYRVPHGRTCA